MIYFLFFLLVGLIGSFVFYFNEYYNLSNYNPVKKEIYLIILFNLLGILLVIYLTVIYFLK